MFCFKSLLSDMSYIFSNAQEIPYKRHNYTVYPNNTVKQHRFKPCQVPDNRPSFHFYDLYMVLLAKKAMFSTQFFTKTITNNILYFCTSI